MTTIDPLVKQLQDRRHQRGVKPYVVAELAGLAPQIVYSTEAGDRSPRLCTLRAWADALGCDLQLVPRTSTAPAGAPIERNAA